MARYNISKKAMNYIRDIRKRISDEENELDAATMIDILAEERTKAQNKKIGRRRIGFVDRDYKFAAGVLCFIFTPIKPAAFVGEMSEIRKLFKGILNSKTLQEDFRIAVEDFAYDVVNFEDVLEQAKSKGMFFLFKIRLRGEM